MSGSDRPLPMPSERTVRWVLMLAGALVAATTAWTAVATKDGVTTALAKHSSAPHPPTSTQLESLRVEQAVHDQQIKAHATTMTGISARIDFLTENAVEQAKSSPRARRAVDTAARKVRRKAKARGEGDPLAGVDL